MGENSALFTSQRQPDHKLRGEKVRAMNSVKQALMNAFDTLGNEAFFVELGRGSAEDRRCLAMILAKLIPVEVQGALDATLTVKVVTQLGVDAVDVTRPQRIPQEPKPVMALPAAVRDQVPAG